MAGKRPGPAPAADLYTSDWFRKARAYAERYADTWFVLSALHGVLAPDVYVVRAVTAGQSSGIPAVVSR